jgi:hypothetical protein
MRLSEECCRRLGFSQLLNLDEKVEDFAVLRVNDLTVFVYVTAEHFLLSETSLRTAARPLERREFLSPF